ncbi:MAG: hypothetical protein KGL53_16020, partial [Elusimicrobia bacterium]|nr:hypothetical protein [Elusimicrobiota bacterium]
TIMADAELSPYADHICREEGVAFMRRLLDEEPRPMPYAHPLVVSRLKVFSLPVSRTGMVFAGLGCANGCDFCCTSFYFKRRHIKLLPTGRDIFEVMRRYQDEKGIDQFTILDEDFLLNRTRAEEFRRAVLESGRTFSTFCFASIRALSQYRLEELVEMGIDGLWIGYEGTRSGYEKQKGRSPEELFPDLRRHGILVLASMIVGFDYQDEAVVADELRGLLRLRPALSQFLIYGPTPGTPFYERIMREGRLRPELVADKDLYYRSSTGFASMVTHPTMSRAEIERLQTWCFEEDFRRLGPSMFRSVRVWQAGYEGLRDSPGEALRRKGAYLGRQVRRSYPLFLAGRLLAPNPRIRRWLTAFERRAHRTLGAPTLAERALAVAALGAAFVTRLTLRFDVFQHPRLPARRMRWEEPSPPWRLWGAVRDGVAAELRVRAAPAAAGYSWLGVEGALDRSNAAALAARLRARLEEGRQTLVLNLERLEKADRAALAELARVLRHYRERVRIVVPVEGELAACLGALARLFEPLLA